MGRNTMVAMTTVTEFWAQARAAVPTLPKAPPTGDRVWGFGATPEHADGLLALVLAGVKTGTASYVWEYESDGEPLPEAGGFDVILDGSGAPQAVIETLSVDVVPFDEVTAEHAHAEGEDDRTLESWRRIHREFFEQHVNVGRAFQADMPMACGSAWCIRLRRCPHRSEGGCAQLRTRIRPWPADRRILLPKNPRTPGMRHNFMHG